MTETNGGLSPQSREFVAVGASVGAGCHPCLTHHLKAGADAGLSAQALLAAITAAERVTADASARMAQHARRQLSAPGSAEPNGTVGEATLAALGAAVAANSMPNIERYLTEVAQLGVSHSELADAVNVAHQVQQNAARIHARLTGKLLDAPLVAATPQTAAAAAPAGQAGECEETCPCHDDDTSADAAPVAAQGATPAGEAAPAAGSCAEAAATGEEPSAAAGDWPAQDLTQETFLRAISHIGQLRDHDAALGWLYRIATNTAADHARRARGADTPADPERLAETGAADPLRRSPALSPLAAAERSEMSACVDRHLASLPGEYRVALLLHDGHGLTNPQIAAQVQCTVATVKIRVHRARARLRAALTSACDFGADDRGELVCEQR